jgi:hypothetical protein
METLRSREYSIKQHTQFSVLNMVLNHLVSNINDFLRRTSVFLHSLERHCFAQSWCSSSMNMLRGRQRSFQMLTQFTMLNKCKTLLLVTLMLLLQEPQCFSHSLERGDSAQRWCCSSKKTLRGRQFSFKEQTEFTILTMLLDPLVSNIKESLTNLQFFSHLLVCGDSAQSWCCSSKKTQRWAVLL